MVVSVAGKQGKGKIGDKNVTIKFTKDKKFTISGDIEGEGEYTQTLNFVRMVTKRGSIFFATIDGDTITGSSWIKSPDGKKRQEKWNIKLVKSSADTDATDKSAVNGPSLGGKWTAYRRGVRFDYDFKDDKTFELRVTSPYFTQSKQGRWEQKGNIVSARFQESGTPGTGGFSRERELTVTIVSRDKMVIDGDTAARK